MLSSNHRVSFLHTVLLIAVVGVLEAIVTFWLGNQNYDPYGPKRNRFHTTPDNSVAKYRKLALIFKESALLEAHFREGVFETKGTSPPNTIAPSVAGRWTCLRYRVLCFLLYPHEVHIPGPGIIMPAHAGCGTELTAGAAEHPCALHSLLYKGQDPCTLLVLPCMHGNATILKHLPYRA